MVMVCSLPVPTILGPNVQNAVGINVKGDLDLRHTTRSRGHTVQPESTQDLVVLGKLSLTLQHNNLHGWLRVSRSGEDLTTETCK